MAAYIQLRKDIQTKKTILIKYHTDEDNEIAKSIHQSTEFFIQPLTKGYACLKALLEQDTIKREIRVFKEKPRNDWEMVHYRFLLMEIEDEFIWAYPDPQAVQSRKENDGTLQD